MNTVSVDIDQFFIKEFSIGWVNLFSKKNFDFIVDYHFYYFINTDILYLPKEIYNIITIETLRLSNFNEIKNEIINLRKLKKIYVTEMKVNNIIIKMENIAFIQLKFKFIDLNSIERYELQDLIDNYNAQYN